MRSTKVGLSPREVQKSGEASTRDQHRRKQTILRRIRHSSYDVGDTHYCNSSMAFSPIIPSNFLQGVEQCNTRAVRYDCETYGEAKFGEADVGEA